MHILSAVIDRYNDQSGTKYVAKYQYDVMVGANSSEIGNVDMRLSCKI